MLCAQLGRISGSSVVSVLVAFFYLPSRPVGGFSIMHPNTVAFDRAITFRVACSMTRVFGLDDAYGISAYWVVLEQVLSNRDVRVMLVGSLPASQPCDHFS